MSWQWPISRRSTESMLVFLGNPNRLGCMRKHSTREEDLGLFGDRDPISLHLMNLGLKVVNFGSELS